MYPLANVLKRIIGCNMTPEEYYQIYLCCRLRGVTCGRPEITLQPNFRLIERNFYEVLTATKFGTHCLKCDENYFRLMNAIGADCRGVVRKVCPPMWPLGQRKDRGSNPGSAICLEYAIELLSWADVVTWHNMAYLYCKCR